MKQSKKGKNEWMPHYCSLADDVVILHSYRDENGNETKNCLCAPVCKKRKNGFCVRSDEKNEYAGPTL